MGESLDSLTLVGVDLVWVPRLAIIIEEYPASVERIFSPREISDAGSSTASLAARWAVREAVGKILGGVHRFKLRDVEVGRTPSGRPSLVLTGAAKELAVARGLCRWDVSLAHDGDYALAAVVATGN